MLLPPRGSKVEAADAAARDLWVEAIRDLTKQPGGGGGGGGGAGGGDPSAGRPTTMTERAKKQAHYMQRDLELKKTKHATEKRKTEMMKSLGGMKYTAIAMANRA